MTAEELRQWRTKQRLSRTRLAAHLSPPHGKRLSFRVIEGWEQGRYAIPCFLWRALRDLERELTEKRAVYARS
jgi:hypothetical protein